MNEDKFDELFDKAFENAAKTIPPTFVADHRGTWFNIQRAMKRTERKRAFQRRIGLFGVIAASILIGALLFGNPVVTKAFNPFYQSIKELPGQLVTFIFGTQDQLENGAKTKPPTDEGMSSNPTADHNLVNSGDLQIVTITSEEAKASVNFPLPSFGYLPEGHTLTRIEIFLNPDEIVSNQILFTYTDEDQHLLRITMNKLVNDSVLGSGANTSEATVEEIGLKHGIGYLTLSEEGTNKLEFLLTNIYVHIMGYVSKDEIIKLADQMIQS